MKTTLGLDIGTSGIKAILCEVGTGRVVAKTEVAHEYVIPQSGWAESNPDDWWSGVVRACRDLATANPEAWAGLSGIGVAGQMHGLVVLDGAGKVIRPCIMWNDQRSSPQCDWLEREFGLNQLLEWTGNRVFPGFTLPKLLWVREHEPANYGRIARVLLPKDYIVYRLTGKFATDVSDASGMALLDVASRDWNRPMMEALDLSAGWFAGVHESADRVGEVSPEIQREMGMTDSAVVVAGAGDQAAQALGSGLVQPGEVSLTLGTSGVIFAVTPEFQPDADGCLHAFCHASRGTWHLMGVMLSAAGSLQWWLDWNRSVNPDVSLGVLLDEAAKIAAGSEGLWFAPYLSGERNPFPNPDLRGAFQGVESIHRRGHFTRAVLEGVAANFGLIWELMLKAGVKADSIRVSGGGSRSDLWLQILASALECRLVRTPDSEGAALGGAILAGQALGEKVAPRGVTASEEGFFEPNSGEVDLYRVLRERLREVGRSQPKPG